MYKSIIVVALLVPALVSAQSADMRESITNAIVSDPRAAQMTAAEINALVDQMQAGAVEQEITPVDIEGVSYTTEAAPATTPSCVGVESLLCAMNSAFGFDGKSGDLPFLLWMLAGIAFMLLAIFELRLMRGQWHWLTHDPRYK